MNDEDVSNFIKKRRFRVFRFYLLFLLFLPVMVLLEKALKYLSVYSNDTETYLGIFWAILVTYGRLSIDLLRCPSCGKNFKWNGVFTKPIKISESLDLRTRDRCSNCGLDISRNS